MKSILTALLLAIPALVVAEQEIIMYPLSPYFEFGKTNTFLISVKNTGDSRLPVPAGLKMEGGVTLPRTTISVMYSYIELTNGIPHIPSSGFCCALPSIETDLVIQALAESTEIDIHHQLHGDHFLNPEESVTYQINWTIPDPRQHPEFRPLVSAMAQVQFEFDDFGIITPCISLYQKPKSNQSTHSITASGGSE
ncbi:hypothetical protein [Tichowtungia aerotolerans]|uniref:Uncharacterized protein n=1 Tax=Tichowtungia aerotolerans TaxID=2697043 RepID=A0A6P1MB42_9BACT|nr:hypothetical protein [Tichowtungia aerotolerans]QHI68335.1 hypothetical protein GT409_02305 [Tichowtungia aerotolerans]